MRALRVVVLGAVFGSVVTACSSAPVSSATVYGPVGHQFTVAFPSPPRTVTGAMIVSGLPGEIKSYGYALSSDPDIFADNAPVPKPPAFAVGVVIVKTASDAKSFLGDASVVPQFKPVTRTGATGVEFVGLAGSSVNQGTKVSDPKATEGVLVLDRGTSVYLVLTVTAHPAQARAFLGSFRIR